MNSTNTIFLNGRTYSAEELEEIIARHDMLYNFFKKEHARVNGGDD